MNVIKKLLKFIADVIGGIFRDNVNAYSAQVAFFETISFIPFIMLMISIMKFAPVTQQQMMEQIINLFPRAAREFVSSFVMEAYQKSDAKLISITAISALWAASIGVFTLTYGINQIYCKDEAKSFFALRIISLFYTVVLLFMILMCLGIFLFGNTIASAIQKNIPDFFGLALILLGARKIVAITVLSLFFLCIFMTVTSKKTHFAAQIPGAILSATGWVLFSSLFSYYYENLSNYSYLYGSLSIMVFFMLWLFFCIYILFIGAEVNNCIEERLERAHIMKIKKKNQ